MSLSTGGLSRVAEYGKYPFLQVFFNRPTLETKGFLPFACATFRATASFTRETTAVVAVHVPRYAQSMVINGLESIAAAPGWVAVAGSLGDGTGEVDYPLVGWGVVPDFFGKPEDKVVIGLVYAVPGDGVVDAEQGLPNFIGYAYRG